MIAIKIGTTSWRQTSILAVDEVEFTGTWIYDIDGFTSLMVWDSGLNNARAMTPTEIATLPAQKLAAAQLTVSNFITRNIQLDAMVGALRTLVLVQLDEFNLHALKINSILDAVDAATSLADLKTRIAAIPDYPQRTKSQIVTAMQNKATSGAADA